MGTWSSHLLYDNVMMMLSYCCFKIKDWIFLNTSIRSLTLDLVWIQFLAQEHQTTKRLPLQYEIIKMECKCFAFSFNLQVVKAPRQFCVFPLPTISSKKSTKTKNIYFTLLVIIHWLLWILNFFVSVLYIFWSWQTLNLIIYPIHTSPIYIYMRPMRRASKIL